MIQNRHAIAILMATYNGAEFLREQLDSLLQQTFGDWCLFVHDDGSEDDTCAILREYSAANPDRMVLLDYPPQGGACANFMSLLERVESVYYMFCDQDDVWHPNKISASLSAMRDQEQQALPDTPVVVHCDLRVVEENMAVRHPSLRAYSHINVAQIRTLEDCVINFVTGCAMMFNHPAKGCAMLVDWHHATMHDAWISIRTLAAGGRVYAIENAMIDYRQSRNNAIGAIDGSRFTLMYRILHCREIVRRNILHYRMLRSTGYPSLRTYLKKKMKLYIR